MSQSLRQKAEILNDFSVLDLQFYLLKVINFKKISELPDNKAKSIFPKFANQFIQEK